MSKIRSVLDLVIDFFDKHPEYDGLYDPSETQGCACTTDDLAPCGCSMLYCCFGVQVPCDCGDHDFHIADPDSVKKESDNA